MGSSPSKERYQLFQRTGSTKWQMRFSIKGQGQIKRSLETSDRIEAERKAEEIWFEANYRARQGLSAKARTFEQVAEDFIAHIQREVERGSVVRTRASPSPQSSGATSSAILVRVLSMESQTRIWSAMPNGDKPTGPKGQARTSPISIMSVVAGGFGGPSNGRHRP